MMKYLLYAILFFALSPGVLLTLPPINKKYFMTGKTSIIAAGVHAIIFAVICYFLSKQGMIENFMLNKHYDNKHYFDVSKKENNGKRCCLTNLNNEKKCPNKNDGSSNIGTIRKNICKQN